MNILEARNITKSYIMAGDNVIAVDGLSMKISRGELVSIMGPSGSGKTTLLNLLGCLDRPTGGSILIEDREVSKLSDAELNRVRLSKIGFVFQRVNLIPILSAVENVELPMEIAEIPAAARRKRALELLDSVGLSKRSSHKPYQLSSGEQQRVGIARSLANNPAVILADEPTGNLDSHTTSEICDLILRLSQSGQTIVMVTHNYEVGAIAHRKIIIRDGQINTDDD